MKETNREYKRRPFNILDRQRQKRQAIRELLQRDPDLTANQIASRFGVSHSFARRIQKEKEKGG